MIETKTGRNKQKMTNRICVHRQNPYETMNMKQQQQQKKTTWAILVENYTFYFIRINEFDKCV